MAKNLVRSSCIASLMLLMGIPLYSFPGPYDGNSFKGRIAFSSDGNHNDEDDWGAFPVAIAILDAMGVKNSLVHAHFNNILTANTSSFEREMRTSALGAQQRYGLSRSIFFDCQGGELNAAISHLRDEINKSTANNPLYIILAGPMDVVYRAINQSNTSPRKYVYCISHNSWNDGYGGGSIANNNKRDVIPTGITWIQVKDGNPNLAHPGGAGASSTSAQWSLYHWLRDSSDANLRWIYSRLQAEGRADISDSTMTYFLTTGDEDGDLTKFENLLDRRRRPSPLDPRNRVRMEAENFVTLQNYSVEHGDRQASQRLNVRGNRNATCRIRTEFKEPYTAVAARYDVVVRYYDESGQSRLQLKINGQNAGSSWTASNNSGSWRSRTVRNVTINQSDDIEVEVRTDGNERGELDYVELSYLGSVTPPSNQRPSVSITSPTGGTFSEGSNITIQATASDSDGTVTNVEFYRGTTRLGQDGSSPYSYTWNNVSAGTYTLTAVATDDDGATTTSNGVTITVTSSSPTQSVTGLVLVNADTDQDIGPLRSGDTIDLGALSTANLNVRAETSPSTVGSVRFAYDGNSNFRTETTPPYALAGDTGGDYWNWTPTVGSHSLTATPYSGSGGSGTAGNALTITFTVLNSPPPPPPSPPPPPGGGTGLTGEFYDGIDFSTFLFTRTDASIDFDWGAGAPDPSTGADAFSIRWSGLLDPQHSETYTFTTNSDDGVRLWVDGRLLVDNWTDHGATLDSGTLALTAGQQVPLVLEYYENGGDAVIQLLWSSASQAQQIIPSTQLLIQDTDGDGMADTAEMLAGLDLLDSDQDGNGILDGQDDWDGDGTDNQTELATGSNPGSPPGGTTTSSSGGGCGATGLEVLLLLALIALRRIR